MRRKSSKRIETPNYVCFLGFVFFCCCWNLTFGKIVAKDAKMFAKFSDSKTCCFRKQVEQRISSLEKICFVYRSPIQNVDGNKELIVTVREIRHQFRDGNTPIKLWKRDQSLKFYPLNFQKPNECEIIKELSLSFLALSATSARRLSTYRKGLPSQIKAMLRALRATKKASKTSFLRILTFRHSLIQLCFRLSASSVLSLGPPFDLILKVSQSSFLRQSITLYIQSIIQLFELT